METLTLAEAAVDAAVIAANGKEPSIKRAIQRDIELIEAHAHNMDNATIERAERTIQQLKLRRRAYDEKPNWSKR